MDAKKALGIFNNIPFGSYIELVFESNTFSCYFYGIKRDELWFRISYKHSESWETAQEGAFSVKDLLSIHVTHRKECSKEVERLRKIVNII